MSNFFFFLANYRMLNKTQHDMSAASISPISILQPDRNNKTLNGNKSFNTKKEANKTTCHYVKNIEGK